MSSMNGSGGTVMDRILKMSFIERERLCEVKQVEEGKETIKDMARKIGLSYRQTLRIVKRYKEEKFIQKEALPNETFRDFVYRIRKEGY